MVKSGSKRVKDSITQAEEQMKELPLILIECPLI